MQIKKMCQPEAAEIADRWKYDGEYAFYDMTAYPEDYAEIVTAEKRGDRYFSVFSGDGLMGFFCVASFNQRAIKVYERAGFVKTGTAQVSTNGGTYDFTRMELNR